MTFKEFKVWCNNRAADGCWGMRTVILCINIVGDVNKIPFWKREKIWRKKYEKDVVRDIVLPINRKMIEVYGVGDPIFKEEA